MESRLTPADRLNVSVSVSPQAAMAGLRPRLEACLKHRILRRGRRPADDDGGPEGTRSKADEAKARARWMLAQE
jgi:hypothetical protein